MATSTGMRKHQSPSSRRRLRQATRSIFAREGSPIVNVARNASRQGIEHGPTRAQQKDGTILPVGEIAELLHIPQMRDDAPSDPRCPAGDMGDIKIPVLPVHKQV
ncbi:hypothetical protein CLAIMM_13030 [Cladophialophora immunda]|nr:hypothetical protein CLAIMM_13030 [Cladophialophora immunda]